MRAFVTGGSGFIGRRLLAMAADTPAIEWHAGGRGQRPAGLPASVSWHHLDLMDHGSVRSVFDLVRPTHLLHLAWLDATGGAYWNSPENIPWVEASLHLARAFVATGGRRIVGAGTCAEYAWTDPVLSEATTPLVPASVYGRSKHALRALLDDYCRLSAVEFAWGRVFFVHGPGEVPTRLLTSSFRAIREGRIAECGDGDRLRDYLHVDDVAAAFTTLLTSALAGPVNIGSGHGTAIRTIVNAVAERLGRPDLVRFGARAATSGDPAMVVADTTRLGTCWRPAYTVNEGLRATIDALLASS